jgi:rhamnosyltransferase subunit B
MGAIIHHGGIGTINQTLIAGIPQLILAHDFDRPDNGDRVKHLGIGECLPPSLWRPERVAAALGHLMTTEVQKRCHQISLRWANVTEAVAALCDMIDRTP